MPFFLLMLIMDVIKHFNFNNTVILNGQKKNLMYFSSPFNYVFLHLVFLSAWNLFVYKM